MLRIIGSLILALVVPVGVAVAATPPKASANGWAPVTMADLSGESCSAILDDPRTRQDPEAPPPLKVTCNGNGTAIGLLRPSFLPLGVPVAGPARRAAIEAAAKRSLAASEIGRRMNCQGGRWLALTGGGELNIASCALREGNWPQLLVTFAQGRTLYQAAGLPTVLSVLIQTMTVQSGTKIKLPPEAAGLDDLSRLLGSKIPPCSARDFATLDAAIRQARIFDSRGDAADAETGYRTALDIQSRVFGPESLGVGEVLTALALEVSNQSRFDEAASYFRRAEPLVERSTSGFYRARLLAYQALDAANHTHYDDALKLARAASALRRRSIDKVSNFSDDAGGLAAQSISRGELLHSLMIEAQMLLRLEDLSSAEAAAGEALDIVVHTDGLPPWWRPNVLAFMGDLNAREGRLAVSERQHLEALRYRQRSFGETGPTALSHLALGRIYGAEGAREAALASFHAAFDIMDKERATRSAVSFNQISPFLKVATEPGVKQTPAIDAEIFRAIQLTGASVTDQTIERSANRLASADPALTAMIRQSDEARRRLGVLRITYAEETDKPAQLRDAKRETALAGEVVAANSALSESLRTLRKTFPAYSELAEPGAVTLDAFRSHLSVGEALITFALGSKESWVVLVSRDQLVARPLAMTEGEVADAVTTLRRAFVPRLGKLPKFDLPESGALYTGLLGPVEDRLGGIRRIIVVSHGALASLPLAVLVKPAALVKPGAGAANAESYQGADWLVKRFAISQVPTARAFVALREAMRHRTPPPLPFLGFAAPNFTGPAASGQALVNGPDNTAMTAITGQCRAGGPLAPALLRALTPLPETAAEAGTVGQLLGASPESTHVGADASETVLRKQPLDQYGVLYFATHGLLPGELRCQSEPGLVLSPPSALPASRSDDGLLESSEIAAFKLNADLVVLSACNTAESTGRFGGDALSGLADSFFYAGARGVIASHWEVPSAETVSLMTGMFKAVKASGTAEALRQSQLRLIAGAGTQHPFYWAAFTLIGDGLAP